MSVVSVCHTFASQLSVTNSTVKETRTYLVETNDNADTCDMAAAADDGETSVPLVNQVIDGLIVKSKQIVRDTENPNFFAVTVELETDPPSQHEEGEKWNVDIELDGESYTEDIQRDVVTGAPIANSALQPFDPPIIEEFADEAINISYNTLSLDEDALSDCRLKVNSDNVSITVHGYTRTFEAGTLWLKKATARATITAQVFKYWTVNLGLVYRSDGWIRKIVDRGLMERVDGKLQHCVDGRGDPVPTPVYLNGAGRKLAEGATIQLKEFSTKKTAEFMPLFEGLS